MHVQPQLAQGLARFCCGTGQHHHALPAIGQPRRRDQALSVSRVTFEALTRAQIQAYAATGEPLGKAGAYAIQGRAAMHVARISGSYSGIMGLPMHETAGLLREFGILRP